MYVVKNLTDEEINVLFIGMLCLRSLEVHIFNAVNASILSQVMSMVFTLIVTIKYA